MHRLHFMIRLMSLFIMLMAGVCAYSETLKVESPRFSHFDMTGYTTYYIELDEQRRIVCIKSDDGSGTLHTDVTASYENGRVLRTWWSDTSDRTSERSIDLQQEFAEKYQLEMDDGRITMTSPWNGDVYEFFNGILYVKISGTDSHRYEFADEGDCYGVKLCDHIIEDKVTGLAEYGDYAWEARTIVGKTSIHSDNMAINMGNLFVAEDAGRERDFTYVLFPFIFCDAPCSYTFGSYESSSHLVEGGSSYGAENLADNGGLPWASQNGRGIGDTITIGVDIRSDLLIAVRNGFQSSSKPSLYDENSRVKRLRISYKERGCFDEFLLKDTPDLQILNVEKLIGDYGGYGEHFVLEVLDVYPGSKYDDLCIQSVLPYLWRAPLPIEDNNVVQPIDLRAEAAEQSIQMPKERYNEVTDVENERIAPEGSFNSEGRAEKTISDRGTKVMILAIVALFGLFSVFFMVLRRKDS